MYARVQMIYKRTHVVHIILFTQKYTYILYLGTRTSLGDKECPGVSNEIEFVKRV